MSFAKLEFAPALVQKYDRLGPRYTSYPSADRFTSAYNAETYTKWLRRRSLANKPTPLSLYFHLPFCDTICFYCACNKIITKDRGRAAKYVHYLGKEIRLQSELLQPFNRVEQLHWGGGTPSFLSDEQMSELMRVIRSHFDLAPHGEYSIEIDPRKVDEETIALLRELGFNRISMGVQDFAVDVQRAVNRIQSEVATVQLLNAARRAGFKSVNVDLIYGLPQQTVDSFSKTIASIIAAVPDRIAIYNYAHLRNLFKPQRRINEAELPTADVKLAIIGMAIERLSAAGYQYIGMDHFAKPDDELSVAQREQSLQRNFQGYSTHAACDLVAFGITGIGQIGSSYSQNLRTLDEYYGCIEHGGLPIMRGIELSADDVLRRSVIQDLICNFTLPIAPLETRYEINFDHYFAWELQELRKLAEDGLVDLFPDRITVTPQGKFLIRNICTVFDRYLRSGDEQLRYSRLI